MSKILVSTAALALAAVLTVAAPAGAAERRADGLRSQDAAQTEISSQRRYWRRGFVGRRAFWGPRYGYWGARRYWRPRYAYSGYGYGYYPRYAYAAYPYYYRPWRPFPVFGIGFGFGPRFWW
jgi:hypothetical protein